MDPLLVVALSVLLGVAAGIASGLFGVGGGVIVVPGLLALLPATTFFAAKAASLLAMAVGGLPGLWRHRQAGHVNLRLGLALGGGAIVGAVASVFAVERVAEATLEFAFGIFLVLVGIRLFFPLAGRAHLTDHALALPLAITAGLAAGLLGGAFGIGGGVLMVPALAFAGLGIHQAIGTSLVAVVLVGAASTGAHLTLGYGPVLALLALPVAAGSLVGSRLGAGLATRLPADRLRRAFGALLVLVGTATAAAQYL